MHCARVMGWITRLAPRAAWAVLSLSVSSLVVVTGCTSSPSSSDRDRIERSESQQTDAPSVRNFIAGDATWVLESPDVGLPLGESDTIVLADGTLRSYLHASTVSAGVRDSSGAEVEFPGCVTAW